MNKRHFRCPKCHSLNTERHGIRKNLSGAIQRFLCKKCNFSFSLKANKGCTISCLEQVKITRDHLEGRTSIRTLARHMGHSKTTIVKSIHKITSQCVSAAWIAKE